MPWTRPRELVTFGTLPCVESFGDDEPVVVAVARDARAGLRPPSEVHAAFEQATVYAQRPDRPGLLTAPDDKGASGECRRHANGRHLGAHMRYRRPNERKSTRQNL